MSSEKFLKKYKVYLVGGGLLSFIVLFVVFGVLPSIKKLNANVDNVQEALLDIKIIEEKLRKLKVLEDKFEQVTSQSDNLDVLFSRDQIVFLVQELEKVADQTENEIEVKVLDGEDDNTIKKVKSKKVSGKEKSEEKFIEKVNPEDYFTVEITLNGNYNSLLNFVYKLNRIKFYNTIIKMDILAVEEDNRRTVPTGNLFFSERRSVDQGEDSVSEQGNKRYLETKLLAVFYLDKSEK